MKIAGIDCRVKHSGYGIKRICDEWMITEETPDMLELEVTAKDLEFEREKDPESTSSDDYLETVALLRVFSEAAADKGVILFHSSVMLYDGKAYLFTAPSGTGKTTHCRLWKELLGDRCTFLNGDKPMIDTSGSPVIYGTPWKGKERYGINASAPVAAICFVKRGSENSIRRLTAEEALPKMIRQTYRPRDKAGLVKMMNSVIRLSQSTELFELTCNISTGAAVTSFEAMTGEKAPADKE